MFVKNYFVVYTFQPSNGELMNNPEVQKSKILRRTMAVTLPTIINRLAIHAKNVGVPTTRVEPYITKFVDDMISTYRRSEDEGDRIAMVKGMGNCGTFFLVLQ